MVLDTYARKGLALAGLAVLLLFGVAMSGVHLWRLPVALVVFVVVGALLLYG